MPLVSRTRAILRSAELGFLGVIVRTCTHTPRFNGLPLGTAYRRWRSALKFKRSACAAVFFLSLALPLRTICLIFDNEVPTPTLPQNINRQGYGYAASHGNSGDRDFGLQISDYS